MASADEIVITLGGGRQVDAHLGGRVIHTEQSTGTDDDTGVSPLQLFLSAIGTCAGLYVQEFCRARGIDFKEIRIIERPQFDAGGGLLGIDLLVELPDDFPEKYLGAVSRVVEQCSVTHAIQASPLFRVEARRRSEDGALVAT